MAQVTNRERLDLDGHGVELRFIMFDPADNAASEYGWMLILDGKERMGVFARKREALAQACELLEDGEGDK